MRSNGPWRKSLIRLGLAALVLLLVSPASAQYRPDSNAPRAEVPREYQWSPEDIFPTREAWEQELKTVEQAIPELGRSQGRLGESAATLHQAQEDVYALLERLYKLYIYAQTRYDVDQGVDSAREDQGRVALLMPRFGQAIAYMQPELLAIDPEVIQGFLAEHEGLSQYAYYFEELWRQQEHTLSRAEEELLALTGNVRSVPGDTHEALLGVDIDFPKIVDENGELVPLKVSSFSKYRSSPVYAVRRQATEAFFGTLRGYQTTFSVLLDGVVKSHILTKEARGYESTLEAALDGDNISPTAYRMLIDTVRENLPRTLHRYVELRKQVLDVEGPLTFANLYNPLIPEVDVEYTYEEGRKLIVEGLQPLGKDYVQRLDAGLDPASGWIDVYPSENKRSGAYSNGAIAAAVHPYVLHNFDNSLDAVFTTAHEMGHALHSVYSSENQPPVYASYTTFLAEVASTANEALLTDYMLKRAKDPGVQLLLLNQRLESMRLTIFRQTLFADFELRFHEHAEQGNPLTAEFLNDLYGQLIQEYYGPEYALGENDECEWIFIPHFYYNYYVFTYATGLTSGIAMADRIGREGDQAAKRYIEQMLSAGSSAPPLTILRNAGVDLETPEPIEKAMALFARTVDDFEKTWARYNGRG
ncbi:MAG: oligoendopeptidase F [Candidatus Krumholzibacteriia bacterium]